MVTLLSYVLRYPTFLAQAVKLLSYVPEVAYVFGSDGNASELSS